MPTLIHSTLHHAIIDSFIHVGFPPSVDDLARRFGKTRANVIVALRALQDYHGVVLHPDTSEIWIAHPFSAAPTGFLIRAEEKEWWGNCAWCSLGVAVLVGGKSTIHTVPGNKTESVEIAVDRGVLLGPHYCVHFPIKIAEAWDNVIYTCSMMLFFETESDVHTWCTRHGKDAGDIYPIEQIWHFTKEWYGRHADADWRKWTTDEASAMFQRHGLRGPIWELDESAGRF